jgi:branched-chain amino acid aminotransferase
VTPPLEAGILEGTTRMRILDLCAKAGIPSAETPLVPEDLFQADEVFVSSSVRGILPVVAIDGAVVGRGEAGPVTLALHRLFEEAADAEAEAATRTPA